MKSFTVTLTRGEHTATAKVAYRHTAFPDSCVWSGDRAAFRLRSGGLPNFLPSLDRLVETVVFQAAQSGADHTITDDGGTALFDHDNVLP